MSSRKITSSQACTNTFNDGVVLDVADAASVGNAPNVIKYNSGNNSKFIEGGKIQSGITIKTLQLDVSNKIDMGSNWISAQLKLTFGRPKSSVASQDITKTLDLHLNHNGSNILKNCVSASATVQIKTSSICDATSSGKQRYNPVNKILEVCDGASWTEVGRQAGSFLEIRRMDLTWACSIPNPITGDCTCPPSYTATEIWDYDNPAGNMGIYCHPGQTSNCRAELHICTRP